MDDPKVENPTEEPKVEEPKVEEPKVEKKEPETIPKERFDEVNTELQDVKSQVATLQQQATLIAANRGPAPAPQPQFDIFKEVGLNPDDPDEPPSQKQLKAILEHNQKLIATALSDLTFLADHPDFAQLVGTTEQIQLGQFAEPLTEAFKANPALRAMVSNSHNPRAAAYAIAKDHQQRKEAGEKKPTKSEAKEVIKEAEDNAARVKSASTVKGGAALSAEGRWANASDEEILKEARKHGATI